MEFVKPAATVVVCTKDRPGKILVTIDRVLASVHQDFELLVLDQSSDERTREAMSRYRPDTRVRYVRSQTVGQGASRQEALEIARSEFVLFTDDDCLPAPDWVGSMLACLEDEQVAIVYGRVEALEEDSSSGFTPVFLPRKNETISSLWGVVRGMYGPGSSLRGAVGIGASMAVRRSAIAAVGGFDPQTGPGSRFPSADDMDIGIRILMAGGSVHANRGVTVVHDGLRNWDEYPELVQRDFLALGAVFSKLLRFGGIPGYIIVLQHFFSFGFLFPIRTVTFRSRPKGMKRAYYLLKGIWVGLRHPTERRSMLFTHRT